MAKWFDETILIKYWEDRCHKYELKDGTKIKSAKRNKSFGRYPDIGENYLSDGRVIPAEIEWVTTNFDRHGHDINVLRENEGFLVVFKADAGFPFEQVEIDEEDFAEWFKESAAEICQETLSEIKSISQKSKEPQIFLFHIPIAGNKNFKVALEHGVWGFPENSKGFTRGLPKISQIKKNDLVIFVRNWRSAPHIKVSGGRVSAEKYIGTFEEIVGVVVTRGFKTYSSPKKIWTDNHYPHRFEFRKEPLFVGRDIPCNRKALGAPLHEILRRLQVSGSVDKIDTSLIVKLMSLCTS